MAFVAVQGIHLIERMDLTVHPDLGVTTTAKLVEEFTVMTLSSTHKRSKQVALLTFVAFHDEVYDLLVGVAHHLLASRRGICPRSPGIEKAQEVEYFSDGADRGARVVAGGLLFDRDYRTQAFDALDLWLFQDPHEMLGISRKGVHVAPLALGVDRVKGKRRFSAAAETCHDDEFVAGNVHIDPLQVVRLRTTYLDIFLVLHLELLSPANLAKRILSLKKYRSLKGSGTLLL